MHHRRYQCRSILAGLAIVVFTLSGCSTMGFGRQIPAGPFGAIVPSANGGPPTECRAVPIQRCAEAWGGEVDQTIVRIIVTCTDVCTLSNGSYDIHVLRQDGRVEPMGGGSYQTDSAP